MAMLFIVFLDEHEWFRLITSNPKIFGLVIQFFWIFEEFFTRNGWNVLRLLFGEHLPQFALLPRTLIRLPAGLLVKGVNVLDTLFSQLLRLFWLVEGFLGRITLLGLSVVPFNHKLLTRLKLVTKR